MMATAQIVDVAFGQFKTGTTAMHSKRFTASLSAVVLEHTVLTQGQRIPEQERQANLRRLRAAIVDQTKTRGGPTKIHSG